MTPEERKKLREDPTIQQLTVSVILEKKAVLDLPWGSLLSLLDERLATIRMSAIAMMRDARGDDDS